MISNNQLWRGSLPDGSPAIVRPIRPSDAEPLAEGLRQLSPESKVRRFLYEKGSFTDEELRNFTACDGVNHIAVLLVRVDDAGEEVEPVGVARSIRAANDPELAEAAIVITDPWQGCGVGGLFFEILARRAWESGIRRWQGVFLEGNRASRALLERVGRLEREIPVGAGAVEVIYELREP